MSVIDEVKQKADIVEVIGQYTTLKKAGRNLTALCPFHSEKTPSFFVYPEQQSWHCFGACSTGGDVFSFVMKKESMDFGEALHLLAQRSGVTIPAKFERDNNKDAGERLYQINGAAAQYFHNLLLNSPAGEKAKQYLADRGLSPKTMADFQLGFSLNSWESLKAYLMEKGYTEKELLEAGLIIETEDGKKHDRFRNRLLFPINDAKGRTTGFGARVLDDSFPKYLNSPQTPIFDKSRNLYGINLATQTIRQQNLVVIVEGYMDVIIAHQYGFSNVIAAMGTSITESQVSTLKKLTRNMVLALDADAAGEEAMLRCVSYESTLATEIKVVILPSGQDPDDVIKEDAKIWQQLLDEALPVIDYTFNMVTAKLNLTTASTARDKSLAVDQLLPLMTEIKDNTRRDHYLTKLARLTGTSYRNLENTLATYKTRQKSKKPVTGERATAAIHPLLSSPLEEYFLALLLQHPELKNRDAGLLEEYFKNSQNREIFIAWQQTDDLPSLRVRLAPALGEHLDALIHKSIPGQIEPRYADCLLNLRQKFLQNQEAMKAGILALEAEDGDTAASLAKLEEQGIEASIGLREIFMEKARKGQEHRR